MGANNLKDSFDIEPASEQECLIDLENRQRQGWGNTLYEDHYPLLAYEVLSSDALKTKAHLCVAFACSKPTINRWIGKYPEFREAVECGLSCGEVKFRDKIRDNAFKPSKEVNNGLIKMMGSNVYGIEEHIVSIVESTTIEHSMSAEEEMKERGIPVPDIGAPDIGVDLVSDTGLSHKAEESQTDLQAEDACSLPEQTKPNLEGIHLGGEVNNGESESSTRSKDASDGSNLDCSNCDVSLPGSMDGVTSDPIKPGKSGVSLEPGTGSKESASKSIRASEKASLETSIIMDREKAVALDNARLRAQVQSQEATIEDMKKASRRIKEFGHDFESADKNVCSPFGDQ